MTQRRIFGLDRTTLLATAGGLAALGAVVVLIGLALLWPLISPRLNDWLDPPFAPRIPVNDAVLHGIDLHRLHAELLPRWMIAFGRRSEDPASYAAARQAVREAVAADANLVGLFRDLTERLERDAFAQAHHVAALIGLWNEYLESQQQPYWLDHELLVRGGEPMFYTKSYRVVETAALRVDGSARRIRFLLRVDRTNVVEGYDGKVTKGEDGGYVLVDRVFDQTVNELWPLLAQRAAQDPVSASFQTPIKEALTAALEPERLQRLQHSAVERERLLRVLSDLQQRRTCGSSFRIQRLPRLGFERDTLAALDQLAARDRHQACPSITPSEAQILRESSAALRPTEQLMEDLEVLAAWAARGTAAHEAQHVADAIRHGTPERSPCPGCEDRLDGRAVAELSAYLTSFRGESGVVALFQACSVRRGPHGRALRTVLPELLPAGCEAGPPIDLEQRVVAAEQQLFHRTAPQVEFVAYPAAIPLPGL